MSSALNTALIVIDLQREFVGEDALFPVPGGDRIVEQTNSFVSAARDLGATVIFTAFAVPDAQPLGRSTERLGATTAHRYPHAELLDVLNRTEIDIVIEKPRQSAFVGTALELILHKKAIEHVIVLGVTTHSCCLATAIDAAARDFSVTMLSDLTASPPVPPKDGLSAMTADEAHIAALQLIAYSSGRVALSSEILHELGSTMEKR